MKRTQSISLAGADRVLGKLYLPSEIAELTDSMMSICVGDYGIDVSWYPDRDPFGKYYVNVFKREWEDSVNTFESPDPQKVADFIEGEIAAHSRRLRHSPADINAGATQSLAWNAWHLSAPPAATLDNLISFCAASHAASGTSNVVLLLDPLAPVPAASAAPLRLGHFSAAQSAQFSMMPDRRLTMWEQRVRGTLPAEMAFSA